MNILVGISIILLLLVAIPKTFSLEIDFYIFLQAERIGLIVEPLSDQYSSTYYHRRELHRAASVLHSSLA